MNVMSKTVSFQSVMNAITLITFVGMLVLLITTFKRRDSEHRSGKQPIATCNCEAKIAERVQKDQEIIDWVASLSAKHDAKDNEIINWTAANINEFKTKDAEIINWINSHAGHQ